MANSTQSPMARRIYDLLFGRARELDGFQGAFLLAVRLYWGWGFFVAGRGKLLHLEQTAVTFAGWGIPAPGVNAFMAGMTECTCGLLLLGGFLSRVAPIPLIGTMIVAYLTAHRAETLAIFSDPDSFVTAPPFLFLLASVIVLLFGPGWLSVDALIAHYGWRAWAASPDAASPGSAAGIRRQAGVLPGAGNPSRRDFQSLIAAAVAGLVAGGVMTRLIEGGAAPPPPGKPGTPEGPATAVAQNSDKKGPAEEGTADSSPDKSQPDKSQPDENQPAEKGGDFDENLLLADQHVCRGLNTCKGKGKDHNNACAGQGTCALVKKHACNGLNDCKGHGGCGEHPGQNQCSGQGACAVPLKPDTWKKARAKFEQLLTARGEKFSSAPDKS